MAFEFPKYHAPDFTEEKFRNAPDAKWAAAELDGVAPEGYHSTSMYPEYFKLNGQWRLAEESRMDACVVLRPDGRLDTVEARSLKAGDRVIVGRTERGEEGIYMHCDGFVTEESANDDQFVFRQGRSRETSYAKDYDDLAALLRHERTGAVSVNRRFAGGVRRPNWPVSALGRRRLSRRKPQPIALTSPKTADVGTWTVKRPAESGERKTATSRLRVGGSARVRSRGRCPKPRQHWRSGQKKAQPIRVGLWVNGGAGGI